jgi:FKBP-type peptidyl-prolyl cis-trans isomerase FkpA
MTTIKTLLTAASAICLLAACSSSNYEKTKSGLMYRVVEKGSAPQVKPGEFIKLQYTQKINDSIIGDTKNKMPVYVRIDSVGDIYDPREIFPKVHKGDSIEVVQLVDSFLKRGPGSVPSFMKKGDKLLLTFRVTDVYNNESAVQADQQAEVVKENAREVKAVEDKLGSKKAGAQKTPSGAYVVIGVQGDGPQADSGKQVAVRYTGRVMETGKEFESNMDSSKQPYRLVIGRHEVIQGWDEGLRFFKKGGRGTMYIPGFLAYGPQPGPGGKPFENLEFDIQVVDVTDAPAQQPNPMMPPPPADTTRRR